MVFPTVARHFSKPWAIKNEVMRCLSWLYSQSDSSLPAFDQLSDRVVHGHDARGTPCVAATEGIALFKVPLESLIKRRHNAVRAMHHIAGLNAIEGTGFRLF